jgi:stage IV sporulation protein FB
VSGILHARVSKARIAGATIRIHLTYLLLWLWAGIDAARYGLPFLVLPSVCVLARQFGHMLVARAFKIKTTDVTLGPFGEVVRLDRIPEKLSEAVLFAIAGPIVNVTIAMELIAVKTTELSSQNNLFAPEGTNALIIDHLVMMNLFLAAFNMIPALPMDGGRLLRTLLAIRFGYARAAEMAGTIGQWTAFATGALGLFYNPQLILIAIFIYLGACAVKRTPLGW